MIPVAELSTLRRHALKDECLHTQSSPTPAHDDQEIGHRGRGRDNGKVIDMSKRTSIAMPAAMLAVSGLALAGIGLDSGLAQAQIAPVQIPCSGDVLDADFCGFGGGGGGGRNPFGTGPGQVDLLPGVTQNGPTDLTPGRGTHPTPEAPPVIDPGLELPASPDYVPGGTFCIFDFCFPY